MDPTVGTAARSGDAMLESVGFDEELYRLMEAPQESGSSFTALLDLPPTQAVKLIHSPESSPARLAGEFAPRADHPEPYSRPIGGTLTFPSNTALIERAAKFSVFAAGSNSPDTSSVPSNSTASLDKVKKEPMETDANANSLPEQLVPEAEDKGHRAAKRKERGRKGKGSTKKCKNESSEESEKLPYVHVRARRGQATDSHSLAERARREKINARMKLLQELVPGCDKISGTALVLDEIINHVQSLQHQVEFLSMRLAAVNPRVDVNLDSILAAEGGSLMDNNFPGMVMPLMWPQVQANGHRQQYQQQLHLDAVQQPVWGREEDNHNLITPESSLLSYDSSANSVLVHLNHLKMER